MFGLNLFDCDLACSVYSGWFRCFCYFVRAIVFDGWGGFANSVVYWYVYEYLFVYLFDFILIVCFVVAYLGCLGMLALVYLLCGFVFAWDDVGDFV